MLINQQFSTTNTDQKQFSHVFYRKHSKHVHPKCRYKMGCKTLAASITHPDYVTVAQSSNQQLNLKPKLNSPLQHLTTCHLFYSKLRTSLFVQRLINKTRIPLSNSESETF